MPKKSVIGLRIRRFASAGLWMFLFGASVAVHGGDVSGKRAGSVRDLSGRRVDLTATRMARPC